MSDYGEPDLNDEADECEIHKYAPLPCKDCRIAELEAQISTKDAIISLHQNIEADLKATIERVRGLPRWEVGDENRRDIVCEDGEFVRWADVQEAIK